MQILRHACCKHCEQDGCPRFDGHSGPCRIQNCDAGYMLNPPNLVHDDIPVVGDIMVYAAEERLQHQKQEIIDHVVAVMGAEPVGLRTVLRALSHPDIAGEARRYFDALDVETRCTKYEPPWSCARETEAVYENMQYGLLGAAGGIGFDETWCEPCRKKVLGDG